MVTQRDERDVQFITTEFSGIPVYTFALRVSDVVHIQYVAVRGRDNVEGAVQRILNKRRVSAIRDFVLNGNMFFNTFILNWTNSDMPIRVDDTLHIPVVPASAQVIDGQHRLAGLEAAMNERPNVGDQPLLVSLCNQLTTAQAASIFLNINSEQRPVPKSLIYDLFGDVYEQPDHAVIRAGDIAAELNDNQESPLYKMIKYPGMPRGVGLLDLSTVVASLKGSLENNGIFQRLNLNSLNYQKLVVTNFFLSLRSFYDRSGIWSNRAKNPFFKSAGFSGAMEFLTGTLLMRCADRRSFSVEVMMQIMDLDPTDLLELSDIKSLDGKTARRRVREYLEGRLTEGLPAQDQYEF